MIEAGNIDYTPYDKQIYVYDGKTLKVKAGITMPDDTVINNETMSEHYIQFSFNLDTRISFKRTDYIRYNGITYRLREDCQPTEVSLNQYTYELRLEAPEMFFQDCIMFYTMQGYKEVEWVLFGKASQFIEIAADNVSTYLSEDWKPGIIEPGDFDLQNITFNSHNVFDALTEIAEAFNAEWYVDYTLKTINLVYKHEFGDAVTLRRETELIDINKAKDSEIEYCTRLFAFGSTRNIPKNYRKISDDEVIDAIVQKKLRLPASVGDYIDAFPNIDDLEIIERVKVFEDIYPKRIGNITSIRSIEKTDEGGNPFIIYYFKDSGLNFKSEYILPNETLMVQFGNNSWLNGRSFELAYNDKTKEFEIIVITEGENYVPNDILKPKLGDEYVLYGFDISLVGDQYVPEAETELETAAREYLSTIATDTATYTCTVNPVFKFENNLDLPIGQKVLLKSLIFESGEKESRIYGYRKYPVTGTDEYVVGDVMDYKRLARMENETEENKKVADVQYLEAMKLANNAYKNVKALNYIRRALENETTIDGGLILTSLIQMGIMQGNIWVNTAGINGVNENEDDVALWAGGTLEEAVNLVANPSATNNVAAFVVTHGGKIIANNAFIKGTIEALSGKIGGFDISGTSLMNTGFNNDASIIFRNDTYKTFAGIGGNVLPASTGLRATARFENNDTSDQWGLGQNIALMVQASGSNNNIAISMNGGVISGLAMKVRQINSDTAATYADCYFSCYNQSAIVISLPIPTTIGKIYYFRINNNNGISIDANSIGGKAIMTTSGALENSIWRSARGELVTLIWDGQYWLESLS